MLLHLQSDDLSGQRYFTKIETANTFHTDQVTFLKLLQCSVAKKIFPAALVKTHLDNPAFIRHISHRHIHQPVKCIHAVAPAGTAPAIALTSIWLTRSATITTH